jgi:ABC-type sulfate transport system permease component
MNSFGSVLGTIALLLAGLVGLLMSLCGAFVTFAGFSPSGSNRLLLISIPSLLAGIWFMWLAGKKLRERHSRAPKS